VPLTEAQDESKMNSDRSGVGRCPGGSRIQRKEATSQFMISSLRTEVTHITVSETPRTAFANGE
jgi:hypothetical protein